MITDILFVLVSLVLLFFGADWLVAGASNVARRFGVSSLLIGLTIVAYGTSTPELVVSLKAGLANQPDIAIGNVVGSNIFNACFILGAAAIVRPIPVQLQIVRLDTPIMLGVSILCGFMLLNGHMSRLEGFACLSLMVAYTVANVWLARRNGATPEATVGNTPKKTVKPLWVSCGLIALGLGTLVAGSTLLVEGAVGLARAWSVSEAVIGLTIVAAGTSMPELATSIVAAMRGESDIAVANVIGSNIFNILGILGSAALVTPLQMSGIGAWDIGVMLFSAAMLWPILWSGGIVRRWEGMALLSIYMGYLALVWPK